MYGVNVCSCNVVIGKSWWHFIMRKMYVTFVTGALRRFFATVELFFPK